MFSPKAGGAAAANMGHAKAMSERQESQDPDLAKSGFDPISALPAEARARCVLLRCETGSGAAGPYSLVG